MSSKEAEVKYELSFRFFTAHRSPFTAHCSPFCAKISTDKAMETNENDKLMQIYGKRVQRCYGCFIPYHLKDMYLGEDVTYFCENCRDGTMFHFEVFSKILDRAKFCEITEKNHHH